MKSGAFSSIGAGITAPRPTFNIEPSHDHIAFEVTTRELEMTEGGIVLPDSKEISARCTVTAVGPGPLLSNGTRGTMSCKPGDEILFKGTATSFVLGGKKFTMIQDSQVVCIVREGRVVS